MGFKVTKSDMITICNVHHKYVIFYFEIYRPSIWQIRTCSLQRMHWPIRNVKKWR